MRNDLANRFVYPGGAGLAIRQVMWSSTRPAIPIEPSFYEAEDRFDLRSKPVEIVESLTSVIVKVGVFRAYFIVFCLCFGIPSLLNGDDCFDVVRRRPADDVF